MASSSQAQKSDALSSRDNLTPVWPSFEPGFGTGEILGDFGGLWRYFKDEKEKWSRAQPTKGKLVFPVVSTTTTNARGGAVHQHYSHHSHISHGQKQPPQPPNSSSSECSSDDELHELAERILAAETQRTYAGVKKVHFDESPPEVLVFGELRERTHRRRNRRKVQRAKQRASTNGSGASNSDADDPAIPASFQIKVPIPVNDSNDPVHVFIDNSNIFYGFLQYYRGQVGRRPKYGASRPKLDYGNLFTVLERGRKVDRKVLVASSPLEQNLDRANDVGYDVSVLSRVHEKEQCVDELIHLKILESLLEYHPPGTIVLASGDGNDAQYFQGGFHKCVVMALTRGWKVEIVSWQHQLSHNFLNREFLNKWKGRYHVVFLDWFAHELGCHV